MRLFLLIFQHCVPYFHCLLWLLAPPAWCSDRIFSSSWWLPWLQKKKADKRLTWLPPSSTTVFSKRGRDNRHAKNLTNGQHYVVKKSLRDASEANFDPKWTFDPKMDSWFKNGLLIQKWTFEPKMDLWSKMDFWTKNWLLIQNWLLMLLIQNEFWSKSCLSLASLLYFNSLSIRDRTFDFAGDDEHNKNVRPVLVKFGGFNPESVDCVPDAHFILVLCTGPKCIFCKC